MYLAARRRPTQEEVNMEAMAANLFVGPDWQMGCSGAIPPCSLLGNQRNLTQSACNRFYFIVCSRSSVPGLVRWGFWILEKERLQRRHPAAKKQAHLRVFLDSPHLAGYWHEPRLCYQAVPSSGMADTACAYAAPTFVGYSASIQGVTAM